jgi:hypothetical protein
VALEQLSQIVTTLGQEAHALALELRPTALDDLGLYIDVPKSCRQAATKTR